MNIRTLVCGVFVSLALTCFVSTSFSSQTAVGNNPNNAVPDSQKNAPPSKIIPPTTKPDSSDLTVSTSTTKPQSVSDDDINRFTNTIVLIKDFYVKPAGDNSFLK